MAQEQIDRILATLEDRAAATMQRYHLPGLAVGIVQGDQLIYARGFGLANMATCTPVTTDTSFRIGSISKTMTTVGLMQLWEQGKFQLDDPINKYLRAFKVEHPDPAAPPITFRHLLTHRSGVGPMRVMPEQVGHEQVVSELGMKPGEFTSLAEHYNGRLLADVYPGTKWAYDNHGYAVVGQLVEDISGEPFADYMIKHVFEPLGMFKTDYLLSERVRDRFAQGYAYENDQIKEVEYLEIVIAGAGSVFSSVNEMAKYASALLHNGANSHGRVVKPETLKLMLSPHFQLDERLPGQGLAFRLEKLGGHPVAWHTGGWAGFVSMFIVAPEDGFGVIAFTNATDMAPKKFGMDILAQLLDVPDEEARYTTQAAVPASAAQLTGVYHIPEEGLNTNFTRLAAFGDALEVLVEDGALMLKSRAGALTSGARLYPIEDGSGSPAFWLPYSDELAAAGLPMLLPNRVAFKRGASGTFDCFQLGFFEFYR